MMDHPDLPALRAAARARTADTDPSHDWSHIERVERTARHLAREVGADERLVAAAAWLHDLVNVPKSHPARAAASRASAEAAAVLLRQHGFDAPDTARVMQAIEEHSYSRGLTCSSLESQVLQDADRLDALGAIGVLRAATCGTLMGARYYDPDDPLARQRPLDDRRQTLDHFPLKLLRLSAGFHTAAGRREAERRTRWMQAFVAQLMDEIGEPVPPGEDAWPRGPGA